MATLTPAIIMLLEYITQEKTGGYFINSFELNGHDCYIEPKIFQEVIKYLSNKKIITGAEQIDHAGGEKQTIKIIKSTNSSDYQLVEKPAEICGFNINKPRWEKIKAEINKLKLIQTKVDAIKNMRVSFEYKKYETSVEGKLKIADYPELSFTKTPASILNFFYQAKRISNEYKNYKDFQVFYAKNENVKNINSDEFSKKIEAINKRIKNITKGLIREMIIKKKSESNEANLYKLKEIS